MKAARYGVVAFPKLDTEVQLQRLREKYDPWPYRVRPYIQVVSTFTPATLDEIQNISEHVSTARRSLHPLAITCHEPVERGEYVCCAIDEGRDRVVELHRRILGGEPMSLLPDASYEPLLWLCRVPDPQNRKAALLEAGRIDRSVGVVDSLAIIRVDSDEDLAIVAVFPFGIGRVDFHERLTS